MFSYIGKRAVKSVVSLFLMTILIFMLARIGGDPLTRLLPETATKQDRIELASKLGLDKTLPEQYWDWLRMVSRGDLGKSILSSRPVVNYMKTFVPNTVELAFFGMLLGLLVGLPLGVLAGLKRGRSADVVARTIAILGQSAPLFWVGLMLMYFFAIQWPIFPVLGGGTGLLGTVLPSISLGFYMLPGILRITRSAMIEAMDSDFITLARIKGLSEAVVICKHALRNALIPIVTFSGMYFAILMSGVVVTEVVFAWPWLGLMTFKAALGGDYPLLQGLVLLVTAVVIVINLIVDIAYVYIDPRIRYQKR